MSALTLGVSVVLLIIIGICTHSGMGMEKPKVLALVPPKMCPKVTNECRKRKGTVCYDPYCPSEHLNYGSCALKGVNSATCKCCRPCASRQCRANRGRCHQGRCPRFQYEIAGVKCTSNRCRCCKPCDQTRMCGRSGGKCYPWLCPRGFVSTGRFCKFPCKCCQPCDHSDCRRSGGTCFKDGRCPAGYEPTGRKCSGKCKCCRRCVSPKCREVGGTCYANRCPITHFRYPGPNRCYGKCQCCKACRQTCWCQLVKGECFPYRSCPVGYESPDKARRCSRGCRCCRHCDSDQCRRRGGRCYQGNCPRNLKPIKASCKPGTKCVCCRR